MKLEELKNWLNYSRLPEDEKIFRPYVHFDYSMKMMFFENYLESIERFLKAKSDELESALEEVAEKFNERSEQLEEAVRTGRISFDSDDYQYHLHNIDQERTGKGGDISNELMFIDEFANILRKSFFGGEL